MTFHFHCTCTHLVVRLPLLSFTWWYWLSYVTKMYSLRHNYIPSQAYLTQNKRPQRLATRVNRTYNLTNRGLIRVRLWPIECIRESRTRFLKLKIIWYRCCVRVWSYKRSYKTVRECVRSCETEYTTVHKVHFTSVHVRFSTIPVRPIQFEQYMDKYGQTRPSLGINGRNVYYETRL